MTRPRAKREAETTETIETVQLPAPETPDLTAGPGIVAETKAKLPGRTPHQKRVVLVQALRQYGHSPQGPEYVGLMALAQEHKIEF